MFDLYLKLLKMQDCLSHKDLINSTVSNISTLSFKERKDPNYNTLVDSFLDELNRFKEIIKSKTSVLNDLVSSIEQITWFQDIDEDSLKKINEIVVLSKDTHSSLIQNYIKCDTLRRKGIAKEELRAYKQVIDDFKEVYEDLEMIFFQLKSDPEFIDLTNSLNSAE